MATKIDEIDKKIDVLSDVINNKFRPESISRNKGQLAAYLTSYGTADKFYSIWAINNGEAAVRRALAENPNRAGIYVDNLLTIADDKGGMASLGSKNKIFQDELTHLIQERTNQEKLLQDEKILQELELTKQAESKTKQEEEKIKLLQEQLKADINKTAQEKWKIEQEMEKAKLELEKAKLAATLGKQGGEGNVAAGQTLLGTHPSQIKQGTNAWVIAGISVGALVVGVVVFKVLK